MLAVLHRQSFKNIHTPIKYSKSVKADWGLPPHREITHWVIGRLRPSMWCLAHLFQPKIPPLARDWLFEAAVCQLVSDWSKPPPLPPLSPVLKIPGDQSAQILGWKRSHLTEPVRTNFLESLRRVEENLKAEVRGLMMEEQRLSLSPVTSLASGRSLPSQYTIDQILGNPPRDTKDPSKLQTV